MAPRPAVAHDEGMSRSRLAGALTAGLAALTLLTACGGAEPTTAADPGAVAPSGNEQPSPGGTKSARGGQERSAEPSPQPVAGRYVSWADFEADRAAYADSQVVLFFHAPWCPSCRATEEAIDADGVPDGLTIVKVDFDTATDLRQQYGVTVQHTFVHVDADGTALRKWTGTVSGDDIVAELA